MKKQKEKSAEELLRERQELSKRAYTPEDNERDARRISDEQAQITRDRLANEAAMATILLGGV